MPLNLLLSQPTTFGIDDLAMPDPSPANLPFGAFRLRNDWLPNAFGARPDHRVGEFTGLDPAVERRPLVQRADNTDYARSAIQVDGDEMGIWLNSQNLPGGRPPNNGSLSSHAAIWWNPATAPRPIADASALYVGFRLQVPYCSVEGGAAAFVKPNLQFQAPTGHRFFVGVVVFDARADGRTAAIHADDSGTSLSIAIADAGIDAGSGWWVHSEGAFTSATFTTWRRYVFVISGATFATLLGQLRTQTNVDLSQTPADYRLVHFNLGPEVFDPGDGGYGQLGMSFRDLQVGVWVP